MSYEVGTHIDLTYINRPAKTAAGAQKKSIPGSGRTLYEVGTQFVFNFTPQGFKAAIKIPVAFA